MVAVKANTTRKPIEVICGNVTVKKTAPCAGISTRITGVRSNGLAIIHKPAAPFFCIALERGIVSSTAPENSSPICHFLSGRFAANLQIFQPT